MTAHRPSLPFRKVPAVRRQEHGYTATTMKASTPAPGCAAGVATTTSSSQSRRKRAFVIRPLSSFLFSPSLPLLIGVSYMVACLLDGSGGIATNPHRQLKTEGLEDGEQAGESLIAGLRQRAVQHLSLQARLLG